MTPAEGVLCVRDLVVRRDGRPILDIDRFQLRAHERVAVLGPNGAGKSTLLRCLGGLLRPDSGTIALAGRPADEDTLTRTCAAVLQRPLLRRGSVIDNAAIGLRFRGVDRRTARREAQSWLDRMEVGHLSARRASTLSGGEAQRVSIARALAVRPRVLLLDEPFAALDERSRGPLVLRLAQTIADDAMTTLLVTHDRREAAVAADRVLVLADGSILADGDAATVLARADLADVLGADGILERAAQRRLDGRLIT